MGPPPAKVLMENRAILNEHMQVRALGKASYTHLIAFALAKALGESLRMISSFEEHDGKPYRRKIISFTNVMDRELGIKVVKVDRITRDQSPFNLRFEPGHPAANPDGYVEYPNVSSLVEMMDMREAQRSYRANLKVLETTRSLAGRTLDLLRG